MAQEARWGFGFRVSGLGFRGLEFGFQENEFTQEEEAESKVTLNPNLNPLSRMLLSPYALPYT